MKRNKIEGIKREKDFKEREKNVSTIAFNNSMG